MAEPVARQPAYHNIGEVQAVAKDLSLISLVPRWTGTNKQCPLHEILGSLEDEASLGILSDTDKVKVTSLKLSDAARLYFNAAPSCTRLT
jgi:hypothetical protein